MPNFSKCFLAAICAGHSVALAQGGTSVPLVSKSVSRLYPVVNRIFAFDQDGRAFSRLDFFTNPNSPQIVNGTWPHNGGSTGGVSWRQSLLLHGTAFLSDTVRSAYIASLAYNGTDWKGDSLLFPLPVGATSISRGSVFTASAIRHDSLILGCGRLGLAFLPLAAENAPQLFTGGSVSFFALPTQADTLLPLTTCAWNSLCRTDTLTAPAGGLDSVLAISVDSSAVDSTWLLIATTSGLRRGLLGGNRFAKVSLPGIANPAADPVQGVFTVPERRLLWAFTVNSLFFSDDHGATFRVPPAVPGIQITPAMILGYGETPRAAASGDTAFINFNLRPGLIAFHRDSLLRNVGTGMGEVLIDAEDSLDVSPAGERLTSLAVARNGSQAVLAVGSTLRGVYYRRLDLPGKAYANINRLRVVQGSLGEVITYPTVFTGEILDGSEPEMVRFGYRLKKDGKVTITVFNYAMEKVRTIVKNAPRRGGIARSENPSEDRWDGLDQSGRRVSVGTYYIVVESDQSEKGFGKCLVARGKR